MSSYCKEALEFCKSKKKQEKSACAPDCTCSENTTKADSNPDNNPINHPDWYNKSLSGVECIEVVEHMNFCIGNAIKYLWRAGLKGSAKQDLEKAKWYINRELDRLEYIKDPLRMDMGKKDR